jgi:hypothetical protein
MNVLRTTLSSALVIFLATGTAFAQSSTPAPKTNPGPAATPGTPGAPGQDKSLDVPLHKPQYQPPAMPSPSPTPSPPPPPPTPTPQPDPVDENDPTPDPTDETDPPTLYGEEIETEEDTIFYVLDVSCSMGWDSQSYTTADGRRARGPRIDRAKSELTRSIMGLSENFKFNVIAYDCSTRQWSRGMKEADDSNKQDAIRWIGRLSPTGATGTGPACALALGDKENMSVVLLTDGAPNCGASGLDGHRRVIRNANTQGAVINVFGIAASGSYRSFCRGVASDAGGSYFDVP